MFGFLDSTKELNSQGVGLGLYINKMIVEKFEGQVSVRSQLNQGSTFAFSFHLEERNVEVQSVYRKINLEIPEVYQHIYIFRRSVTPRSHVRSELMPADSLYI